MSDIRKVRETRSKDDGDWEEWPYPDFEVESVVSGELRRRILASLEREEDGCEVRLIESEISGGWSEFTQEDDHSIELRIGEAVVWESKDEASQESAMASFLRRFGG